MGNREVVIVVSYIIRRLLLLPLILFGVSLIIFGMLELLGPDKLVSVYIRGPESEKVAGAAERIIKKYGLDQPLPVKYAKWVGNILKGDLGWSLVGKQPVLKAILSRFPYTLELALWAIVPVVFVGIWLGVVSAIHHNRFLDHFLRVFAIVGWSFPDFVFGLFMILIFYSKLGWFPPGYLSYESEEIVRSAEFMKITGLVTIDSLINGRFDVFLDALRHLIAPVITLAYLWWAYILRITRSSMLEVLRKEYIRTARSKGLPEDVVIHKHAKRNALIPVATVAGQMIIALLAGTVIIETVFNRPGLGKFMATAATQLDYMSIIGGALFYSLLLVLGNLVVDVSYAIIDPRIRLK